MAICTTCGLEMTSTVSCLPHLRRLGGRDYVPVRNGQERGYAPSGEAGRCGDCDAPPGGVHHPGCDLEECPRCHHQALSCGCAWEPPAIEEYIRRCDPLDARRPVEVVLPGRWPPPCWRHCPR